MGEGGGYLLVNPPVVGGCCRFPLLQLSIPLSFKSTTLPPPSLNSVFSVFPCPSNQPPCLPPSLNSVFSVYIPLYFQNTFPCTSNPPPVSPLPQLSIFSIPLSFISTTMPPPSLNSVFSVFPNLHPVSIHPIQLHTYIPPSSKQ